MQPFVWDDKQDNEQFPYVVIIHFLFEMLIHQWCVL